MFPRSLAGAAAALVCACSVESAGDTRADASLDELASNVSVIDGGDHVRFTNADGHWTIHKACTGTAGPGYISRMETLDGHMVSDGLNKPWGAIDPVNGGLGVFLAEAVRSAGPVFGSLTGKDCAWAQYPWGVIGASPPSFGANYYDQDVYFTDRGSYPTPVLTVRYQWRFFDSDVRLYARVIQTCDNGACGNPATGTAYLKAPMFIFNVSGKSGASPFRHVSTFTAAGEFIDNTWACSWTPPASADPRRHGGNNKCFYDARARTRFDFAASAGGGCNSTNRKCFNVVFRAYPNINAAGAGGARNWENGMAAGFDRWARLAAGRPFLAAGGCGVKGVSVTSPTQDFARSLEYSAYTDAAGNITAINTKPKAWENCTGGTDAPQLFRRFGPGGETFSAYFSLSVNGGWKMNGAGG